MKLSVIIVNYNVEYFLEQCLHSVYKALNNLEAEVFVVDNASVDGSVEMVAEKFPQAHLIANKDNLGFSKANNQAMRISKGEYVLLLNPDTVVEEDTFDKVVAFMDAHPDAGGLGVKMIDGKGKFLPESKRGLPTPSVAFYKISGLSRLFPRSKRFGKYHLGYLDDDETHEIEILAGAFMLMRKSVLDEVGLLDEAFFMYGEDIDLSWRIVKGGYKNYYYPHTRIIHYKGESTKKSSVNYVFVFYNAMIIFARKHFSAKNAKLFSFLINMAIWLRASMAILNRFIKKAILPLLDGLLIGGGLFAITYYYSQYSGITFPENVIKIAIPAYTIVWLMSVLLSGGYDKPVKLLRILKGLVIGTGIILAAYALLPKNVQFSRIIILLGSAWAGTVFLLSRILLHLLKAEGYHLGPSTNKRFIIIGKQEEAGRVSNLLSQTISNPQLVGIVHPQPDYAEEGYIGHVGQLEDIIRIHKADELIFCASDMKAQEIISMMSILNIPRVDFKIAPPESLYIIGSNSIESSGDLYVLDINSITKPENKRNKRLFDLGIALLLLLLLPVTIWFVRKKGNFIANIFRVIAGKRSWIGYSALPEEAKFRLPRIRKGVISPLDALEHPPSDTEVIVRLNVVYAKDYRVRTDMSLLLKGFRHLGN